MMMVPSPLLKASFAARPFLLPCSWSKRMHTSHFLTDPSSLVATWEVRPSYVACPDPNLAAPSLLMPTA